MEGLRRNVADTLHSIKCNSQRYVEIFDVLNMESFAESSEKVETLRFLNVGSQFFDFFKSLTKFREMVVNNLMPIPIDQRASKTKIIGLPDLQFGVRNSENCWCAAIDTILFSDLLMDINRS